MLPICAGSIFIVQFAAIAGRSTLFSESGIVYHFWSNMFCTTRFAMSEMTEALCGTGSFADKGSTLGF